MNPTHSLPTPQRRTGLRLLWLVVVSLLFSSLTTAQTGEDLLRKAQQAGGAGQVRAAERYYHLAMQQGLQTAAVYQGLADLYFNARRHDDALALLDTALDRYPDNAALHKRKGWILQYRGDTAEALQALDRALSLTPGDQGLQRDISKLRQSTGDNNGQQEP